MSKLLQVSQSPKRVFDPIKLNRGQVIQLERGKDTSNIDIQGVSEQLERKKEKTVKHTVVCDWFEQTLGSAITVWEEDEITFSDVIYLKAIDRKTKHYEKVYEVYLYGVKFGQLLVQPRQSYMRSDYVQFKVDNALLYTHGWLDDYKFFLSETGFKWVSNTSMHIAIDNVPELIQLATRSTKGKVVKRKGKAKFRFGLDRENAIDKIEIGSLRSEKYGKVYFKADELEDSGKQYISGFWEKNGLSINGSMPRYEICLRSGIANSYDWTRFDDPKYLASIVRTESKNWCAFYYDGRDKNKHRKYQKSTMEYINWLSIGGDLLEKSKALKTKSTYRARQAVKTLSEDDYKRPEANHGHSIQQLIKANQLEDWYDRSLRHWVDDWDSELIHEQKVKDLLTTWDN